MDIENNSPEKQLNLPKIERITLQDLEPVVLEEGGTVIVLQRNAKDNRDPNSNLEMGALLPEEAKQAREQAKNYFGKIFESLDESQRKNVDILVVAADTKLNTPIPGIKSDRKRAVDTAEQIVAGIKECLQKFFLSEKQLINKTQKPSELKRGSLRDLRMLEDSPEFVQFLINKYGSGEKFWINYEEDTEKETREKLGAEGPDDIADRVDNYLKVVVNAMGNYHKNHAGKRLIIWVVSHYDTISPYIKRHIAKMDRNIYLPVDSGAGIVINVGKDRKASTKIQGNNYNLSLEVK